MNRKTHRFLRTAAVTAVVGVIGVSIASAEDMWVERAFVEIRGGKGSLYPVVAKAEKGSKLTVLEHQDRWLRVEFNGQEGFVFENALVSHEVNSDAFAGLKDSQSTGASAANAGKGFTPEDFANAKGYSEEPLKKLEADVKTNVTPQGLADFMSQGKIGDAKSQADAKAP